MGDLRTDPSAHTKYGTFFDAVQRRLPLVDVYDAGLHGWDRMWNLFITFTPNKRIWRERFYKNVPAFEQRSQRLSRRIRAIQDQADMILQVGVLFDSKWEGVELPNVIYTDYTAYLTSQRPDVGRSPFNSKELCQWMELERQAFARAAHICTRSCLVRESVIKDYGIPAEKVTAVGGGANFVQMPQAVQHLTDDPPTALFIGKEFYRKGGDLLLKAFARVREQVPDARLLFLTEDPIPADLPLEGVELQKPTWERDKIQQLYCRSHVFVLPSRLETWGDVLLEAMSYGIPCIGVAGQTMEEIIDNEIDGLIVPPENEQALAQAMIRLLANPELRQKMGRLAVDHISRELTWDQVVARILQESGIPTRSSGRETA